ncbi:putative transcription elongation factor SPT5-1-like protein [Cucumis melo var. makuwa]|uniref:Transcription elongation factor SPT5-1-like protein n=1 Tax=Cucumis melo var. makuwa TaxID=1194695 RepID=A0A5A7U4E0_CUCMM|nr:putative transcription elongation factor SPT5-1-like protein [Cucumis melo var. makuwa]
MAATNDERRQPSSFSISTAPRNDKLRQPCLIIFHSNPISRLAAPSLLLPRCPQLPQSQPSDKIADASHPSHTLYLLTNTVLDFFNHFSATTQVIFEGDLAKALACIIIDCLTRLIDLCCRMVLGLEYILFQEVVQWKAEEMSAFVLLKRGMKVAETLPIEITGLDASRYGMRSETSMHPSRTLLHPNMTPMRDTRTLVHPNMTPVRDI